MIEVDSIHFLFPWLAPKLSYINQHVENLTKCRAVRALRKTNKFIQSHPFISLFLGLSITLGFLPFVVFGGFVSGSLFVTLFAALTALSGALFVAFVCFLAVLFHIVITAASVVLFVDAPYCLAMKLLRFFKRIGTKVTSYTSRLQESFTFADYQEKAQFTVGHEQDFAPAHEEMGGEQYVHHDNAVRSAQRHEKEYLHSMNEEDHLYRPHTEDYLYNTSGEQYRYNRHGQEDYWYNCWTVPLHFLENCANRNWNNLRFILL